jgi:hypothetical protein
MSLRNLIFYEKNPEDPCKKSKIGPLSGLKRRVDVFPCSRSNSFGNLDIFKCTKAQ